MVFYCLCCCCCIDEEYVRRGLRHSDDEGSGESLKSLRWDAATLRKVCVPKHLIYHLQFLFTFILTIGPVIMDHHTKW